MKTGIELSSSQIRRILAKKKYVYIWAKYSLEDKQNPQERKNLKKKLEEYIRISKEEPNKLQVWFWGGMLQQPSLDDKSCFLPINYYQGCCNPPGREWL